MSRNVEASSGDSGRVVKALGEAGPEGSPRFLACWAPLRHEGWILI